MAKIGQSLSFLNKLLHKFEFACTFWGQTRWMPWVKWVSPTIQKTWANSCSDCFLLFSNEAPASNSVQNNISHCVWIEKVKKTWRTCEPLVSLIRGNSLRNCSIFKHAQFLDPCTQLIISLYSAWSVVSKMVSHLNLAWTVLKLLNFSTA